MTDTIDPKTAPRWQRRPDARPEEILRAAMQTFVERGFAATRLEEVAARAGVSKGTLYLYFSNKEELFRSAVQESILPHIQSGEQRIAGFQGSPLLLLREAYERCRREFADTRHQPQRADRAKAEAIGEHCKCIDQPGARGVQSSQPTITPKNNAVEPTASIDQARDGAASGGSGGCGGAAPSIGTRSAS